MKKLIYRFSLFMATLTFVSCLLQGISLGTSITRSAIVFLGTLFVIIIMLKILRWGILIAAPKTKEQAMETKSE